MKEKTIDILSLSFVGLVLIGWAGYCIFGITGHWSEKFLVWVFNPFGIVTLLLALGGGYALIADWWQGRTR